jgi:hypothetical protein
MRVPVWQIQEHLLKSAMDRWQIISSAAFESFKEWALADQAGGDAAEWLARDLEKKFGPLDEIIGGDELYPSETTWYFNAPKPK